MNNDKNIELKNGTVLPVMESFLTIQGEGYFSGKTSYFLRIGGCDVGCHWCDVKESWNPNLHPLIKVDTIISSILENSVLSFFRNFRRAGVLKKRSLTSIVVPSA